MVEKVFKVPFVIVTFLSLTSALKWDFPHAVTLFHVLFVGM